MKELLHQDEMALIGFLIAQTIQIKSDQIKATDRGDMRRLTLQRDLDFSGAVLGKMLVGMEPKPKQDFVDALKKMGMRLNIHHENCPHEAQAGPTLVAPPESIL